MKTCARAMALILGLLAASPVLADKSRDKERDHAKIELSVEEVRRLVIGGELLPLEEILRRNEAQIGGSVIDLHLERKRDAYIYEIQVLRTDGRTAKIEIDARTGMVLPGNK